MATMMFGLSEEILADMRRIVDDCNGARAFVFGSRARGDYGPASDIDLALAAPGLDDVTFSRLCAELDAVPMVFHLDVVRLDTLPDGLLRRRIERDGVPLGSPPRRG